MTKYHVFDREAALERVDADKELFFELIEIFFEDYDRQISDIASAIESSDQKQLEASAHAIKSALGNIGAMQAFEMAYHLEKLGREGNIQDGEDGLAQLKERVVQFQQEVEAFRAEGA